MAAPLMHSVIIEAEPAKVYEAISTSKGLASFWTSDSKAEPKVGSVARFGFGGPVLEMKVEELKPGRLVRWAAPEGFPEWKGTSVTWEIAPGSREGRCSMWQEMRTESDRSKLCWRVLSPLSISRRHR